MKKAKLFLPLVMAIVMMAMCPAKMWADSPQVSLNKSKLQSALTAISTNYTLTFANAAPASAEASPVVLNDDNNLYLYKVGTDYTVAPTVSGAEIMAPADCSYMFQSCYKLTSITFTNFNTANVTDMGYMFDECIILQSLDVSNFNTENVTNMTSMFSWCRALQSLDLSNFNTEKVTAMGYMFYGCYFKSLDLSNFDTKNVEYTLQMFDLCSNLESLTIGNFDMTKVKNYANMFRDTYKLKTLTLKAVPYLKDQTFNSKFTGDGVTVNYNLQLNDNSIVYSGENNLPAPTNWTAAPTYTREMSNEWGTIVVPFAMTYSQSNTGGYKLYKLSGAEVTSSTGTLTFTEYEDGAAIPAGTPMTIKATSTKNDGKYTVTLTSNGNAVNTAITETTEVAGFTMNGTYAKKENQTGIYFIAQNQFWLAEDKTTVPAFRAWFVQKGGTDEGEGDLAKVLNIVVEDEANGIKAVNNEQLTVNNGKFIENGKVVVVKNGKKFNVDGQRMKY